MGCQFAFDLPILQKLEILIAFDQLLQLSLRTAFLLLGVLEWFGWALGLIVGLSFFH